MSDALFTSSLIGTIACLSCAIKKNDFHSWAALSFMLWFSFLLRPSALSVLSTTLLAILFLVPIRKISMGGWAGLSIFFFLWSATCSANLIYRGFWGMQCFSGIPLFGTCAQYLNVENIKDEPIRKSLQPFLTRTIDLSDANWVRFSPDGPTAAIRKVSPSEIALDKTLVQLSISAIKDNPRKFFSDQTMEFFRFLWFRSSRPKNLFPKQISILNGLQIYFSLANQNPESINLLAFRNESKNNYFHRIEQIKLYPYETTRITQFIWPWVYAVRWIMILGLLASPFLFFNSETRGSAMILILTVMSHIVLTNLGADRDGRHSLPLEPLSIALSFSGLQILIGKIRLFFSSNLGLAKLARSIAHP